MTAAAGYDPSIRLDPMGRDGLVLACAYDRRWGDPRRAYVTGAVPHRAVTVPLRAVDATLGRMCIGPPATF